MRTCARVAFFYFSFFSMHVESGCVHEASILENICITLSKTIIGIRNRYSLGSFLIIFINRNICMVNESNAHWFQPSLFCHFHNCQSVCTQNIKSTPLNERCALLLSCAFTCSVLCVLMYTHNIMLINSSIRCLFWLWRLMATIRCQNMVCHYNMYSIKQKFTA